jgi:arylformamidase
MMKLIDLSHVIEPNMPVFPGTEAPVLLAANTIAKDGFAEKKLTFYSHTGTHMDAPAHMLYRGKTLDAYPVEDFYGRAVLADFSQVQLDYIDLHHLATYENQLKQASFLILRTGWAALWGQPGYFEGFPALSPAVASWIVDLGLKGLGVDAISIDRMQDSHFPVHHLLFDAGMFSIENLTNLEQVATNFWLGCFPIQIQNADGAPARAVAFLD